MKHSLFSSSLRSSFHARRSFLAGAGLLALFGLVSCVNPNAQQQQYQQPYPPSGGGYGKNPSYPAGNYGAPAYNPAPGGYNNGPGYNAAPGYNTAPGGYNTGGYQRY